MSLLRTLGVVGPVRVEIEASNGRRRAGRSPTLYLCLRHGGLVTATLYRGSDRARAEQLGEAVVSALRAARANAVPGPVSLRREGVYQRNGSACRAGQDGECNWSGCPQERDGEPRKSGRHCPLDVDGSAEGDAHPTTTDGAA